MDLFHGHGLVLDSPLHDEELTRVEGDVAATKLDGQAALHHEEELVLVLVMMPHELALQLRDLDVLPVQLADDPRAPMLGEQAKLVAQVHFLHGCHPVLAARSHEVRAASEKGVRYQLAGDPDPLPACRRRYASMNPSMSPSSTASALPTSVLVR